MIEVRVFGVGGFGFWYTSCMNKSEVLSRLKSQASPENVKGMVRFGINPTNTLGISIPFLRKLAKEIGKNHKLSLELWDSKIHEARILAGFIDDPKLVTSKQMDVWVSDFNSWDICDQVCSNLFDKTPFAYDKISVWCKSDKEFIRRAGFVMMAVLAVHDKTLADDKFKNFFHLIKKYSVDERNFVKKAINWALRQTGKRNKQLLKEALNCAKEIKGLDSKSAKWIAEDAIRELEKK